MVSRLLTVMGIVAALGAGCQAQESIPTQASSATATAMNTPASLGQPATPAPTTTAIRLSTTDPPTPTIPPTTPRPTSTLVPTPTRTPSPTPRPTPAPSPVPSTVHYPTWWSRQMQQGCQDREPVLFGSAPLQLENIVNIAPYGLMVGAHVIPSDHQGYHFGDRSPSPRFDVLAVGDGEIVHITVRRVSVDTGQPSSPQYHIFLRHSCSIITQYDLLDELEPSIAAQMEAIRAGRALPVREGQVIGRAGASSQGVDLWVADLRTLAPGYVVPQHYEAEAWRLYAIEPFSLFREPLRSQLQAKSIRRVEPLGGLADYDVDGRLIGGWFVENTNGYGGLSQTGFFRTHLAVATHAYDPSAVIVSLGDFQGQARQFAVTANGPDPAQVGIVTGAVKYELRYWGYFHKQTGKSWDYRAPFDEFRVLPWGEAQGTVLMQMVGERRLKVEVFPGRRAEEVEGFTSNALFYER